MGVTNFTPKEVRATGASLGDVQMWLIKSFQKFRDDLTKRVGHNVSVHLLYNGMTTGGHKSKYHPSGEAGDCYLGSEISPSDVFKSALNAGFKGVGIYWNGKIYSYHLDIGEDYRFWVGVKDPDGKKKSWTFNGLIVDPKHLGG